MDYSFMDCCYFWGDFSSDKIILNRERGERGGVITTEKPPSAIWLRSSQIDSKRAINLFHSPFERSQFENTDIKWIF